MEIRDETLAMITDTMITDTMITDAMITDRMITDTMITDTMITDTMTTDEVIKNCIGTFLSGFCIACFTPACRQSNEKKRSQSNQIKSSVDHTPSYVLIGRVVQC